MIDGDAPYDDDDLAADYVLGVLEPPQRAEVAARIERELAFARRVSAWETRLSGLNDAYVPQPPPPALKARIDAQLFPQPPKRWLWSVFGGLMAGGLAAAVAIAVIFAAMGPDFGAELRADGSDYVVDVEVTGAELTVALVYGAIPEGKTLELWQIIGDAAPVSLGTIEQPLRRPATLYAAGQIVAVSLEPLGGSPTGAPTGPVVALGTLEKI